MRTKTKATTGTFDWCRAGQHQACAGKFERFYHGTKKDGKKSVPAIIYTGEFRECDCKCHRKKEK